MKRTLGFVFVTVLSMGAGSAACSTFGEDTPSTPSSSDDGEGGAGTDALVAGPDGANQPPPVGNTCIELSNKDHGFVKTDGPGVVSSDSAGLTVSYSGPQQVALGWTRSFGVAAGATRAVVTISGSVAFMLSQPPALPTTNFYADLGAVTTSDKPFDDKIPAVYIVLGGLSTDSVAVDMDSFPMGTTKNATPNAATFGTLGLTDVPFTMTLEVTWSDDPVVAQVFGTIAGESPKAALTGATLPSGSKPARAWSVALGGFAQDEPPMTIHYSRVCFEAM